MISMYQGQLRQGRQGRRKYAISAHSMEIRKHFNTTLPHVELTSPRWATKNAYCLKSINQEMSGAS